MILPVGRICPPACREGEAGGSVGGDDEFAEGSLAEGGQSGRGLLEREYLLDGHGDLAGGDRVGEFVEDLAGGVGVDRDHAGGLGGHLVWGLHQSGDEPASVADLRHGTGVAGEVGHCVDPVRCDLADLGRQIAGVVDLASAPRRVTSSRSASVCAVAITRAPAAAASWTTWLPTPLVAPMTTMVFPGSRAAASVNETVSGRRSPCRARAGIGAP